MTKTERIGNVLKELNVGNYGNAFGYAFGTGRTMTVDTLLPNSYRENSNSGANWFFGANGVDYHFDFNGYNSHWDAFDNCPPLASIIGKKAQAHINGRFSITNTNGKADGKESNSPIATKIRKLMKRPNPLQSWMEFEAQGYIYHQLFGYNIILPIKPVGFPNYDATALWNIPPHLVTITESNKLFYLSDSKGIIQSMILKYKDTEVPLDVNAVFIQKDFIPHRHSLVVPNSRIRALEMPINNIIGAYETRNELINERGSQGILSQEKDPDGNMPLIQEDRDAIQQGLSGYGLRKRQKKIIITAAVMRWQEMGYPTKDLMLFEEIDDNVCKICDAYGYPYRLLANPKSNSLGGSDANEFGKMLYSDTIIPEAENLCEQWNHFFGIENEPIQITKDFGHLAILQEDKKLAAEVRLNTSKACQMDFLMNVITLGQYRVAIGLELGQPDDDLKYSDIKELIGTPKVVQGEMSEAEPKPAATKEKVNFPLPNTTSSYGGI